MIKHFPYTTSALIFLLLVVFEVKAQSKEIKKTLLTDTTVFFNELTFNSDKEKELYKEVYLNHSQDYFSLIYMAEKGVSDENLLESKKRVESIISTFRKKNILSKGEKKSIKYIYKAVHDEFFTKYELENHFDNIFETGYYNCLSASFIYAMILDELSIPFQINILPNHVNLTAYPNSYNIIIETTDPVKGYLSFDKRFKEKYIQNLVDYKIIDKSDLNRFTIEELFEKNYYTNEVVDTKQLVGAQYYNDALYLIEDEKYIQAIKQMEKSIGLYPSLNAARILVTLYATELSESEYEDKKHLDYLIRILRYDEVGVEQEDVKYEFNKIAENYLGKKGDTLFVKEAYNTLYNVLKNDTAKIDLKEYYYAVLGDYYMKLLDYENAAKNYLEVVLIGHAGEIAKSSYARAIILHTDGFGNKKKALEYLLQAELQYEDLKLNKLYMSYKAEVYCFLMVREFDTRNPVEGEKYQLEMEKIIDNNDVKINEHNIGIAYSTAGSYYFRRGLRNKAKAIIKKGLGYAPDNYELESRLKMLSY